MIKTFTNQNASAFYIGEYDETSDTLHNSMHLQLIPQKQSGPLYQFSFFLGDDMEPALISIKDISKKTLNAMNISELSPCFKSYWQVREKFLENTSRKLILN